MFFPGSPNRSSHLEAEVRHFFLRKALIIGSVSSLSGSSDQPFGRELPTASVWKPPPILAGTKQNIIVKNRKYYRRITVDRPIYVCMNVCKSTGHHERRVLEFFRRHFSQEVCGVSRNRGLHALTSRFHVCNGNLSTVITFKCCCCCMVRVVCL